MRPTLPYTFCVLFFMFFYNSTFIASSLLGLDWTTCEMDCTSHTSVNESTQITEKKHSFLSYSAFEKSSTFLTNTESTKKSRGHNFFVLFFTFYIKIMKNHKKSQKSTKKHEKALKSKLGVFLMYISLWETLLGSREALGTSATIYDNA